MKKMFYNKYVAGLALLTVGLMIGNVVYTRIFIQHTPRYVLDPHFSQRACHELEQLVAQEQLEVSRPHAFAKSVKEQFPYVSSLTIRYAPTGVAYVAVRAADAVCRVNNMVLTANGQRCAHALFAPEYLDGLPHMEVVHEDDLDVPVCTVLQTSMKKLGPLIAQGCTVRWHDRARIELVHKDVPHRTVVCSYDTVPDAQVFANCDTIEEQLKREGKRFRKIEADVRFNQQIVVSMK